MTKSTKQVGHGYLILTRPAPASSFAVIKIYFLYIHIFMHIVYEAREIIRLFSDRMDEIVVFKEDLDSFNINFKEEC